MATALPTEDWHSRPSAAYAFGHDAIALELWWLIYIQMPGEEWEAEDGVRYCLDFMKESLRELAAEINVGASAGIADVLARLSKGFSRWAKGNIPVSHLPLREHPPVPFNDERHLLLRLAKHAIPSSNQFRGWFDLGLAVGRARLELHRDIVDEIRTDDRKIRQGRDTRVKSLLNDVARAARRISISDRGSIPIAKALACLKSVDSVELARRSLQRVVAYDDKPRVMDWPPLGNLLTTLDARLRHQLRDWRVLDNPPQTAQKPQAKNESRTTGWSKEVEARNRWIYKRVMAVTPYKTIIAELRRLIDAGRDWELISSPPGIRKAALEYANRKEVDPPSKRRN